MSEALDREWRRKEAEKIKVKAELEEEVRRTRSEQIRQRTVDAARAVQREKEFWEYSKQDWQKGIEMEKQEQERRLQVRSHSF